jgi:hypothetical protein
VLLVQIEVGTQRLRTPDELNAYIFQFMQAGGPLQPLSREDAFQAFLPCSDDPYLVDRLLGRQGQPNRNKKNTSIKNASSKSQQGARHEQPKYQ